MECGKWDQAEDLLAGTIQICASSAEARAAYAETLWHRGAWKDAVSHMEVALTIDRDDATSTVRTGEMWLAIGDLAKARSHAERALELDWQLAAAWTLRGHVLRSLGQHDRALADLHRALDLNPDDAVVLLAMAELYRQRGQARRALTALQYLTDIYPPGEEPGHLLYLQGLACSELGRYQDAAECYLSACQKGMRTAEVLCQLGEAQYKVGRVAEAEDALRQALVCDASHKPSIALLNSLHQTRRPQAGVLIR